MKVRRAAAPESERDARNDRFKHLAAVAGEFKDFRHASEVLTVVRAVPTILPQLDHATKVGGFPIERFSTIHGESASGKTYVSIGLLLSFLMRDMPGMLVDTERTTPHPWAVKVMGDYAHHPFFMAERTNVYEIAKVKVREFLKRTIKMRKEGKLPAEKGAIVVVDSLQKLVPKDMWDEIMKAAKADSVAGEKIRDRSGQIKAMANAGWLHELVPLLDEAKAGMLFVLRETIDPDAPPPRKMPGRPAPPPKKKVGGGSGVRYDTSLDFETSRVGFYGKENKGERMTPYGEKYRVTITKTKVSGHGFEFKTSFEFHISNGAVTPEGFDRARDILELARSFDIVEGTNWLKYGKNRWQGEETALKKLNADPELLLRIENDCRTFSRSKAEKHEVIG
jgi:RecA/RadA recombinase